MTSYVQEFHFFFVYAVSILSLVSANRNKAGSPLCPYVWASAFIVCPYVPMYGMGVGVRGAIFLSVKPYLLLCQLVELSKIRN